MHVELLFWSGCPSHPAALGDLRAALDELALQETEICVREITSDAEAAAEGFVGSPTIRIDGQDIVRTGDEPTGLTCRVYQRRNGRISPTPDPADVRDALRAALGTQAQASAP